MTSSKTEEFTGQIPSSLDVQGGPCPVPAFLPQPPSLCPARPCQGRSQTGAAHLNLTVLISQHVGPACPSRHSEPTSLPPPMQQRWSGLLGSASGGSEESWEPGESGSRYCYTMP